MQCLKAENEKLKKQINDAEKYIDELQDALRDMELDKENNKDRYRKALEEVREIAKFHISETDSFDVQNDMNTIIDKINEVLKDE